MLKIEKFVTMSPEQWDIVIEGARNPMNSWDRMDSYATYIEDPETLEKAPFAYFIGENDQKLMENLSDGGPVHGKYKRQIPVWVMINAPLYWWKEMDQYKVGTVTNSCSTMHKIHAKEFTFEDFSCEKLNNVTRLQLGDTIVFMNAYRDSFVNWDRVDDDTKNTLGIIYRKDAWDQMIQLLPSSYNQKRLWTGNYEVLTGIYRDRRNHKLDEWHVFCDWIRELPYSELITGEDNG